jgi:hypothetical protein
MQLRQRAEEGENKANTSPEMATMPHDASAIESLTREELLESRLASMTPPPGALFLKHSHLPEPPRASSTPPNLASKLRAEREYVGSPLQSELLNEDAELANAVRGIALDDDTGTRQPR